MRKVIILLFIVISLLNLTACVSKKSTEEKLKETLSSFIQQTREKKWEKVSMYLNDSIKLIGEKSFDLSKENFINILKKNTDKQKREEINKRTIKIVYVLPLKACLSVFVEGITNTENGVWHWKITREFTFIKKGHRWVIDKIVTRKREVMPPPVK